jgi:hypothetical protein
MPGVVTYDNNLGFLKHLAVQAITSDPNVHSGASIMDVKLRRVMEVTKHVYILKSTAILLRF